MMMPTAAAPTGVAAARPSSSFLNTEATSNNNNNNNNIHNTGSSRQVLDSQHNDYITQVVFDAYGRRMATCSGDRLVRLWDLQETGAWRLVGQFQAHRGAVTSLAFGHPEFGPLLATCGTDHEAIVWEEKLPFLGSHNTSTTASAPESSGPAASASSSRWMNRASLTEARRAVTCVEFAPRQFGLQLAVGSADGCVRIYEAIDVMNLAQWPLAATLSAFVGTSSSSSTTTTTSSRTRHAHQPPPNTNFSTNNTTSSSSTMYQGGCTCLSWLPARFEPATLVVGGSHLIVYRYSEAARSWQALLQLSNESSSSDLKSRRILDVAWAPNVGRRYHYIASAEDCQLRVYQLSRGNHLTNNPAAAAQSQGGAATAAAAPATTMTVEASQTLMTEVAWRCQWNVTGTVLASAGDGGRVQLWKNTSTSTTTNNTDSRSRRPTSTASKQQQRTTRPLAFACVSEIVQGEHQQSGNDEKDSQQQQQVTTTATMGANLAQALHQPTGGAAPSSLWASAPTPSTTAPLFGSSTRPPTTFGNPNTMGSRSSSGAAFGSLGTTSSGGGSFSMGGGQPPARSVFSQGLTNTRGGVGGAPVSMDTLS